MMFLPLSPDDQARPPYITGQVGALTREVFIRFVIAATLAQQRFPGLFTWLGKRRYEQAQLVNDLKCGSNTSNI